MTPDGRNYITSRVYTLFIEFRQEISTEILGGGIKSSLKPWPTIRELAGDLTIRSSF